MAGERSIMKPEEDIGKYVKLLGTVWSYLKLLLKQLRSYESRVGDLSKDVNKLRKEEKIVRNKVREEEKRHGRAIDDEVIKWLNKVVRVISEYDDFLKDEDRPYAVFSDGYLPKPAIRYRLSVIVIDITKKVNVLLQTAKHDNFSYWLGPPSFDADFDNIRYESFASRIQTMDGIKKALEDSNVGMIGVYGWSGVGKTSLIKEVAKQVKGNMFDVVIMVNVTSRPDIRSIQGQIADRLGMKLEEESESGRGARLRERLKNPKEKTLVILDNMRVKLDFNMLGIPLVNNFDDSRASYKGCKILMITDSEQLLLSQIDGKGIQTFCVNPLTEKEAELMFKTMAGIGDGNSMFDTLAAQIANKCEGMPRDIVTTANALRNKTLPVWQDAYLRLKRQNLTAMPESSTMLSYDLLDNEELKHTFLLCARMGHDALITDLVRYCIGLGLFQGIYTVREARDRVHALVGKLKELSLLSCSFSSDRFTMQDIVRDVALSIASQQMHAFAVTKGKLDEWPDKDKLRRYTAISLQHCDMTDIMKKFPERINCSRLRVFHLDNKDPCLKIPDNFFNGMKELRVLILIGIHLSSLPSSIKCLNKLRMLCLERCKLGEHLSIIGKLETLRVLSLSGSDIDKLPAELKQLAKLQIFDISNCFKLKEIPADVLSSLTGLEELYVGSSPIQWNREEGQGYPSENASLSELGQLNQLTALDIQIPKDTHLPRNLFFDKLDSYKIVIRDFNEYPVWDLKVLEMCEASRYLELQPENGFNIHHRKDIKILFERVENLLLGQLKDVDDIFYELNSEGFPYLKYLSIVSNSTVKSIVNSKNQNHPEKAFPKLESLFLYEVNNMEHICQSKITHDSFCKLKTIKVKICGQLKNVFFSSMITYLSALETIEVSECNSLKAIVTLERDAIDEIKFPELRSLTLQSLSEFIGFYTREASIGEHEPNRNPKELFDKKVVFSKLERMKLSSIKIQKIWSDQLTGSYFQNLMHLDVNDCWNMRYLLSLSMSKSLMNLQSLFVSECGMMESIFIETEVSNEHESIFPKLRNINLRSMKRLKKIWAKFPLHSSGKLSFGKLDELIIEGCNKLENVFPSYMVGRFRSLYNLKVTNCKSMKEIFEIRHCEKRDAEDTTNLQDVHVEALPKLKHVWNQDPEGILNFKNLKKIRVQECLNLKHIFLVSIAMGLKKLEYLEVWNCGKLKEIVSLGETINGSNVSFEFPKLTTARFSKLPNLESFYGGTHKLCCSTLSNLSVEHCHKFKLFIETETNSNPEIKPVFSPEEVIYNLKSIQIQSGDAKSLKGYMGNYRMHKLEDFQLSGLEDTEILYFFLHRNPNLKSLLLSNCFFKQLVPPRSLAEKRNPAEKSGVVPKLKSLKLMNLPSLKKIGFEEDTVLFRMLECLILKECPCLNSTALSSVSFTYLTNLEVSNCNTLSHLMTPSTAKSLVQLTTMKVIHCKSMETIVSEPENEERVIFRQLKEIELEALDNLISFCSSSRCVFDFPLLEKFVVIACGQMETFTSCDHVSSTPVLQDVCVRHGEEEKRAYWRGDLNFTIQNLYKNWALDKDNMEVSNPLEAFQSSRLKTLKLGDCQPEVLHNLAAVFTSLKNLEELEVSSSTNVKVIFNELGTEMKGYTFPLKKLTLRGLPNLKHVWYNDGEGILSFQNLQEVSVTDCEKLKTLFPVELAKKVERLKKLEIRGCPRFLEIVEGENATTEATEEFSFPHLTSLNLCMLPRLSCFYPGSFTLECPDLNHLGLLFCGNLETFQSQQEAQSSTSVNIQPLFSERKANFILESLKLDWKNTMMLCNGKFPENMLHELVELDLNFDDVNMVSNFPILLLEKAINLEYLCISRCRGLEELFPAEQGKIRTLGHLTTLVPSAESFSNLKRLSIVECHGLKHLFTSSTARKLVHLEEMYLVRCKSIEEILAKELDETTSKAIEFERQVSFSNLKRLSIIECHGLKHLFTSSTARNLVHLEEMCVKQCESMEEILAKELNETTSEAIKFERLNTITLDSLSSLKCFYSGSDTLLLSSLTRLHVNKCLKMKTFSQGDAESFSEFQVSLDPKDNLLNNKNLNTAVKMIQRREFFKVLHNKMNYPDDHQMEWLRGLVTLKLDKCILPYVIPSAILPHLNNLQELQVRDSCEVEVIFDMNHTEIMETASQLKKLTLYGLPELKRVWENSSERVLIFRNLQEVVVSDCENLQTLFPASLAKNIEKLEKLEIKSCHKLQEIVEMEEGTTTNVTEKFVFPYLEKLNLFDLPHVTYFYPQTFTLECPALNHLSVLDCPKLDFFQSTSINRLPLISNLKVISNLKKLKLDWKHISASSSRFRSEQFTEGLKYLEKISLFFDAGCNEKAMLPIEMLQKAPNLIEMSINKCDSPEIFLAQNPEIGEDGMLGQLKILTLWKVSALKSIESEDSSWLNTMCEKLHELNVDQCPCLRTLVHTVSFSCLKRVTISNCPDLQYLFTSSGAKKLMNLEEITVKECKSLKEIVAKEGDATFGSIKFERLNTIVLHSLPSLICFYPGSDTLQLSSLITVHIKKCPNIKVFSQGVIYAELFRGIQMSSKSKQDLPFHQDLNATIKGIF